MAATDKIRPLPELAKLVEELHQEGKRVVLCHGCFDLLHIGHLRYLQKAARLGDVLVVTVTPDRFVNKGPHRPAFPEEYRAEALASLTCVDYVAINETPTAVELLELLKPDIYAKGAEYRENRTPEIQREEAALAATGGEMAYIEDVTSSSTELINRHLSPFPDTTTQYLVHMAEQYGPGAILDCLERCSQARVLVLGEVRIEEYCYCESLQRSSKAPLVGMRYLSEERFAMGAPAVANYLAEFCGEVCLLGMLGADNPQEEWVRSQLSAGVEPAFLYKPGSPTITKRRYLEAYFGQPLFELFNMNDEPLDEETEGVLCEQVRELAPAYDLVVVADYGLGMLTERAVEVLADQARFLAVSPQVNAGNFGYQAFTRYPRADYACLAEQEMRLEYRTRSGDLTPLLADLGHRLQAKRVIVTRGKHGALAWSPGTGVHEAPSLAVRVTDRMGGGDAFFALSSLCAYQEAPLEIMAFVGNVAAAEVIASMGARASLEKLPLRRHIESLLK